MTILGADGNSISTERRVTLEIVIVDTQPGSSTSERAALGFALDSNKREDVTELIRTVNQSIVLRLEQIGFFDMEPGGVDPEAGKGQE